MCGRVCRWHGLKQGPRTETSGTKLGSRCHDSTARQGRASCDANVPLVGAGTLVPASTRFSLCILLVVVSCYLARISPRLTTTDRCGQRAGRCRGPRSRTPPPGRSPRSSTYSRATQGQDSAVRRRAAVYVGVRRRWWTAKHGRRQCHREQSTNHATYSLLLLTQTCF